MDVPETSFNTVLGISRGSGHGGEVAIRPLWGRDDPLLSNESKRLLSLLDKKTGGRRLLRRSDFSPGYLRAFLPDLMILELIVDATGRVEDAIVRLMGTSLAAFYGEETGNSVLVHPSQAGARAIRTADEARRRRQTMVSQVVQVRPDRPKIDIRNLLMPMENNQGEVEQALVHFQLFDSRGQSILPV